MIRSIVLAASVLACGTLGTPSWAADPIRIYSAGSLVAPLKEAIEASGIAAEPVFGPAGLLGERLAKGEAGDLFLSADLKQPRILVEAKRATYVVPFARNKLCTLSRKATGLDDTNIIDRLLDSSVRLATSTPVADPGGDYTWVAFDKAEILQPGAGDKLKAKAQKLIGTPNAMTPIAGKTPTATIFLSDRADVVIYYCSGQNDTLRDVPDLDVRPLPPSLDVTAVYGMTFLSERLEAQRFAMFLLSEQGQAILRKHQLLPAVSQN